MLSSRSYSTREPALPGSHRARKTREPALAGIQPAGREIRRFRDGLQTEARGAGDQEQDQQNASHRVEGDPDNCLRSLPWQVVVCTDAGIKTKQEHEPAEEPDYGAGN